MSIRKSQEKNTMSSGGVDGLSTLLLGVKQTEWENTVQIGANIVAHVFLVGDTH
jgi:hypothetical protein